MASSAKKSSKSPYEISAWGEIEYVDLTMPSGQLAQARPFGVGELVAAGVLESVDTLSSLIDEKHIKRVQGRASSRSGSPATRAQAAQPVGTPEIDTQSLLKDPESLKRLFTTIDRVVAHMIVQPQVKLAYDENENVVPYASREPGVAYTDQIKTEDKMFIFQYAVGGNTDLEQFRKQFGQGMGDVAAL